MNLKTSSIASWKCRECSRENIERAKFCGGCGKRHEPMSDDPTLQGQSIYGGHVRQLLGSLNHRSRSLFKFGKSRLVNGTWALVWAIFILCGLTPILAIQGLSRRQTLPPALVALTWSDLRSHLSRTLGIPLVQVDTFGREILGKASGDDQELQVEQVAKLEKLLDTEEGSKHPFFRLPDTGFVRLGHLRQASDQAPSTIFSDVPVDHALYRAWQPLLSRQIQLSASADEKKSQTEARPFSPMTWEDWRKIREQLLSLSSGEPLENRSAPVERAGPMPKSEAMLELSEMVTRLGGNPDTNLLPKSPQTVDEATSTASRFEFLSAISGLLKETDGFEPQS